MPVLVTCKFDKDWIKRESAILLTTFSPLYVYGKIFQRSRASNCKANFPMWPEILYLFWFTASLMKIQSEVKVLSCWLHFLHYKPMGKMFVAQGQVTPKRFCPIWRKVELVRNFIPVLVTCELKEDPIKTEGVIVLTMFSPL